MRQILFSILMTLIVVASAEVQSLAESTQKTVEATTDFQEIMPGQAPALNKSIVAESLVVAQNTSPQAPKNNPKKDPQVTSPEVPIDRIDTYQCIEYCAIVRQSCEGLAAIQPNVDIAKIGSNENYNFSRDCQKIYTGCTTQCDVDESKVNWQRAHPKKDKKVKDK